MVTAAEAVSELVSLFHWDWSHCWCFAGRNEYWIPAEQINTAEKMFARMLRLTKKTWVEHTDWRGAIARFYDIPYP